MIRLTMSGAYGEGMAILCSATPDGPADENQRWSPACMLRPGHEGEHEATDPRGGLDSTIRWKGDIP